MLETSLSKPPVRTCSNCLVKPARFNLLVLWKTATPDAREALPSSKCRAQEEATSAIEQFNGKEVGGRALKVNEAKPRENRSGGGRGFGDNRGGGYGGNGGRRSESRW